MIKINTHICTHTLHTTLSANQRQLYMVEGLEADSLDSDPVWITNVV